MDQIRANTPAPIKANLMTEQLSVQMSWGNRGCTRAGSPGDQQSRELGPWATRRFRAMMRANAWGHDELIVFLNDEGLKITIYSNNTGQRDIKDKMWVTYTRHSFTVVNAKINTYDIYPS